MYHELLEALKKYTDVQEWKIQYCPEDENEPDLKDGTREPTHYWAFPKTKEDVAFKVRPHSTDVNGPPLVYITSDDWESYLMLPRLEDNIQQLWQRYQNLRKASYQGRLEQNG